MNILLWHVHGSWTTAFVQGPHPYLLPVCPSAGRGRRPARTWDWPASVRRDDPRAAAPTSRSTWSCCNGRRSCDWPLAGSAAAGPAGTCRRCTSNTTPRRAAAASRHPVADRDDLRWSTSPTSTR